MIYHNLVYLGMRFVDVVMAGQLGPQDLAAVSVGGDFWVPVSLMIIGILLSVPPTVSQLFGAGRHAEIGHYVRQAAWLALGAALLGLLVMLNTATLMHWIGIKPEIIPKAAGYARAIAWGLPALSLYLLLRYTSEAVSHSRPLLFIASLGFVVNIIGNYVLMFGKLGFPALGAVGCGYATALVLWAQFLAMLTYVYRRSLYRPMQIFSCFEWPQLDTSRALLAVGLPIAISMIMEGSMFSAAGLMMGRLGTVIVAGHQIALNWAALMFMVPLGLAAATTVRVGQALGRSDPLTAQLAGWTGIGASLGFMTFSAIVMLLLKEEIVGIYTNDIAVTAVAIQLLFMAALFQIFDGLQVSAAGALRGFKDTKIPMVITIIAFWVVGFPSAWYLGVYLELGPQAIWVGYVSGLALAAILLVHRFHRLTKKKDPAVA